jgi:polyphosphate kinase 2 (PPK2 family)
MRSSSYANAKDADRLLEGPDAAGKGGAIKRLTERPDPRPIWSIRSSNLRRRNFNTTICGGFECLPHGQTTIFDRSWYGRVLSNAWRSSARRQNGRAYREINEFERQLADDGAIIIKFYLHITKDEQLDRSSAAGGSV